MVRWSCRKREGLVAGGHRAFWAEGLFEGTRLPWLSGGQRAGSGVWALEAWLGCIWPGARLSSQRGPDSRLPRARLAEKKASIGYTYEDSTVAEVEKVTEKPEEEESPAEEESNSDEDEVIPDIGGVPSLPSPSTVPGQRFHVSPLPLCGAPRAYEPASPAPHLPLSFRLTCVLLVQPPSLFLSPSLFLGLCSSDTVPTWVLALFSSSDFSLLVSPCPSLSLFWKTRVSPVTELASAPTPLPTAS